VYGELIKMSNKCDKIKRKCKYERYKMNKNADEPQEVGTGDLISTEEILTNRLDCLYYQYFHFFVLMLFSYFLQTFDIPVIFHFCFHIFQSVFLLQVDVPDPNFSFCYYYCSVKILYFFPFLPKKI
jgi:hypothetical protein